MTENTTASSCSPLQLLPPAVARLSQPTRSLGLRCASFLSVRAYRRLGAHRLVYGRTVHVIVHRRSHRGLDFGRLRRLVSMAWQGTAAELLHPRVRCSGSGKEDRHGRGGGGRGLTWSHPSSIAVKTASFLRAPEHKTAAIPLVVPRRPWNRQNVQQRTSLWPLCSDSGARH